MVHGIWRSGLLSLPASCTIPHGPAGSPIRAIAEKNEPELYTERDLMGSPYLSADESIVLSAHDIIINSIPAEAILTNQRLMLVDRTHPRLLPHDIPFTAIETVTIGENSGDNPVLALSVVTPDGTRQPLGMVFPQGQRANRTPDRDEWANRIRELSMNAQQADGIIATELIPPWVPGPIPEDAAVKDGEEVIPAGTRFKGPSLSERRSRAADASTKRTAGIIAAIILIIAVIAVAALYVIPAFTAPAPQVPITPVQTAAPTVTATPVMTPAETPTSLPVTEVTTPVPAETVRSIPQTGVWLRVQYDGAYDGTAGAPGRFRDVKGSGEQFFQIPAKDEFVSASITKLDNSGNPLTLEFYSEGDLIRAATMTKPGGTLSLEANLKDTATKSP